MNFILRMLVSAAVIFGVAYLSGGWLLEVDTFVAALWAAVVLAVVNAFVRPVVKILSLPITILTLGLFALVVNALMIYLVAWIVPGVDTTGFLPTMIAAVIISAVTSLFTAAIDRD